MRITLIKFGAYTKTAPKKRELRGANRRRNFSLPLPADTEAAAPSVNAQPAPRLKNSFGMRYSALLRVCYG